MKRVLIVVLSLLLLIALAVPCFAEGTLAEGESTGHDTPETADVVGYSDSRVVVKDFTNVMRLADFDAKNTAVTEYVIGSVDEWKQFVTLSILNNFEGMTIYLGCDLDFTDVTGVKPIGGGGSSVQNVTPFAGTFDGQGYTIDNLVLDAGVSDSASSGYWGLFALLKGGTIQNLILGEGCTVSNLGKTHFRVGGIVGAVQAEKNEISTIDNCWNKATVKGNRMVGGIVGHVGVSENNALKNDGVTKVTAAERDEAYKVVQHMIKNCTNSGEINAITDNVGGIAGHVGVACDFINCRNTGKISADTLSSGKTVGGIVGTLNPSDKNETAVSHVSGCINNGEIVGVGAGNTGGICGSVGGGNCEVSDCHNYGSVTNETEGAKVNPVVGNVATSEKYIVKDNVAHESTDKDATLEVALIADSTISGTSSTLPEVKPVEPPTNGDSEEQPTTPADTSTPPQPSQPSVVTDEETATDTTASSEKKGCASVVSGIPVILVAVAAGFAFSKKRKI